MPSGSAGRYFGRPMTGRAELNLVRGQGSYVDDLSLPGMVYAGFVRSPYAHARLDGSATKPPGVLDFITGRDVRDACQPVESIQSLPHPSLRVRTTPWYALPSDRARYVGEPLAAVAVERRYQVDDVLESAQFDYAALAPVTSAPAGLSASSPRLYDGWEDNVMVDFAFHGGDVDESLRAADKVIETRLTMHRHTAAPLENRTTLADFDRKNSFLTIWTTTQAPHIARTFISRILNFPENSIRVIQPDVGGAFGRGLSIYPEDVAVCLLSMRLGRPVKWVGTRRECLLSDTHAREQVHQVSAGFKRDGTLIALDDKILVDMGVFLPSPGVASTIVTAKLLPGPYRLRNYRVKLIGVCTNKSAFGAYRGFGKEASTFACERAMDLGAEGLRLDRAEIRFRNLIRSSDFPYTTVTGEVYDGGDYHECLRRVLNAIGYEKIRERQAELRRAGRYIGVGISFAVNPSSPTNSDNLFTGWDSATVSMDPSGNVTVLAGVTSPGTQHSTTFSQIVADELGLEPADVRLVEGDTLVCPYGLGNWSDRGVAIGGSSVLLATRRLKEKIALIAAHTLKTKPGELRFSGRIIHSAGGSSITLAEIAWMAHASPGLLPAGVEPGLTATAAYTIPGRYGIDPDGRWGTYPICSSNATAALVEVDPDSFQTRLLGYALVDDSGRIVNPAVVRSQLIGAAVQGVSGALFENLRYDGEGQLLSSTLMDYTMATAVEVPNLQVEHVEIPTAVTPMGTKGAGESGIVGSYAALCGAVEDALAQFGVRVTEMPLSPWRLWELVKGRSSAGEAA